MIIKLSIDGSMNCSVTGLTNKQNNFRFLFRHRLYSLLQHDSIHSLTNNSLDDLWVILKDGSKSDLNMYVVLRNKYTKLRKNKENIPLSKRISKKDLFRSLGRSSRIMKRKLLLKDLKKDLTAPSLILHTNEYNQLLLWYYLKMA